MKTANIDFSLESEKCSRYSVKYMHFILHARKRMRHDITKTIVLLNNHKTFVCSANTAFIVNGSSRSTDCH